LDNEESKTEVNERRAVTREKTAANKRSKRILRPLNTDAQYMANLLPLTNLSQAISSNTNKVQ
jgi:hypothetical protein